MNSGAKMQNQMQAQAVTRILEGGDWVTVQGFSDVSDRCIGIPSASISEWKMQGLIFSIQFEGEEYYPGYALDPQCQFLPRSGLKTILEILKNRSGWELAFWFDSPNSYLGGRRPKELLPDDPEKVLHAARMEKLGVEHG